MSSTLNKEQELFNEIFGQMTKSDEKLWVDKLSKIYKTFTALCDECNTRFTITIKRETLAAIMKIHPLTGPKKEIYCTCKECLIKNHSDIINGTDERTRNTKPC